MPEQGRSELPGAGAPRRSPTLDEASANRRSPMAKAVRSEHARAENASKLADGGLPQHSFRTLLQDLATLAYNVTHTSLNPAA